MKKLFTLLIFALLAITSAWATEFSRTYAYPIGDATDWSVSNFTDKGSYFLVPKTGTSSDVVLKGIFANKTITSEVKVTLNVATFSSGTNPNASTFSLYADASGTTSVASTQSGTLPTSSDYTNAIYTVAQTDASSLTNDLMIRITKPNGYRQIRLKSITVEFSYDDAEAKTVSSVVLSGAPTQTEYYTNQSFNSAGLTITANYTDGTNADVTSQSTFECNPTTFTTVGAQTVTVKAKYNDTYSNEGTYNVTVAELTGDTYTLVTSKDELESGAKYVLLTSDGARAASDYSDKKITTVAATDGAFSLTDNVVTVNSDAVNVFNLTGNKTDGWKISDSAGNKLAVAKQILTR